MAKVEKIDNPDSVVEKKVEKNKFYIYFYLGFKFITIYLNL